MKWIGLVILVLLTTGALAQNTVGKVVWVKGSFKAQGADKTSRVLQKASPLYLHDTLITDKNSQAQIVFSDTSLMTFRENTQFVINEYAYDANKKNGKGKYVAKLVEGGFRTITGLIAKKNPNDYQVNTPVATIGVRGTDYAAYSRHGQTYLSFYEGEPCMRSQGSTLCLSRERRYGLVPGPGQAPRSIAKLPPFLREKLNIVPADFRNLRGAPLSGLVTDFCLGKK